MVTLQSCKNSSVAILSFWFETFIWRHCYFELQAGAWIAEDQVLRTTKIIYKISQIYCNYWFNLNPVFMKLLGPRYLV